MADIQIFVDSGTETRLLTAGKYCPNNIVVLSGAESDIIATSILDRSINEFENNNITDIGRQAFSFCQNLKSVNTTNVFHIGVLCFQNCTSLVNLWIPHLATMDMQALQGCSALKFLDFKDRLCIGSRAFFQCSSFIALVLESEIICDLLNSDAFTSTPVASGIGYIYVPDALVEQYKVATNWTAYANQIKGLSEIPADVQEWIHQQQGGASA